MKLEEHLKMKSFSSPEQRATLNIVFTGLWLTDKINSFLKNHDLSEQQYNVLRILKGQKGNPINLLDVQERMIQSNSNSTRLVEKLRIKGFVNRIVCEENRRKVEISITAKGLEKLSEIENDMKAIQNHPFQNLKIEEMNLLADLLDKLRE